MRTEDHFSTVQGFLFPAGVSYAYHFFLMALLTEEKNAESLEVEVNETEYHDPHVHTSRQGQGAVSIHFEAVSKAV